MCSWPCLQTGGLNLVALRWRKLSLGSVACGSLGLTLKSRTHIQARDPCPETQKYALDCSHPCSGYQLTRGYALCLLSGLLLFFCSGCGGCGGEGGGAQKLEATRSPEECQAEAAQDFLASKPFYPRLPYCKPKFLRPCLRSKAKSTG